MRHILETDLTHHDTGVREGEVVAPSFTPGVGHAAFENRLRSYLPPGIKRGGIALFTAAGCILSSCGGDISPQATPALTLDVSPTENPRFTVDEISTRFKEFQWEDMAKVENRQNFMTYLAKLYVHMTGTSWLRPESLVSPSNLNLYGDRSAYEGDARAIYPGFISDPGEWAFADYGTKRVFVDYKSVRDAANKRGVGAGEAMAYVLWHEWLHLDVIPRTSGEWLNNPRVYNRNTGTGEHEEWKEYLGFKVNTKNTNDFRRFNEVADGTLLRMFMMRKLGLYGNMTQSSRNFRNGVDTFEPLMDSLGISKEELYQMYTSSDFEGLAKRVGSSIPRSEADILKGVKVFDAFDEGSAEKLRSSGVYALLDKNKTP
ncbi:hypothetical protein A3D77_06700 [Candidatus Gottesmanbacteria bacterium RIFCSPHIGHO2_02_FULL_39_11]|uniref:Uncharacterized protein n=1 Tax=Candidatus Gottesmanbacteria bacterium RIFCSPHIGHO2_02_FULL_39_11 TaxID=1798382 RepID=A0A1F5ZTV7_9BACT|nr:MAG: hypothetical protein A3D77_06700 [Candidatus Gottesmanbacteria bacterium RIFCSPHIGHO2_02_FULL_39_11]